ncbi:hypothetical protein KsCSTR_19620 [Candidatus Kuenenia stuttgartiensis]|uniref:Uncharacterized protein n=1 Tax=Kuenenia stuttgartiensis TaxID=174633 RepID=Q1Q2K0_KUEST|nr:MULTISPECIES: hypothetical protein [Kuenenia]MBE7548846.1 hypothetical protein [Planctomycetia bacterium]MBZ0191631.1 hypothetical protein [Candidatus Kuenenia stuttgartiensis]MCF6151948.1 hypothetical protein [Candidatus Kuenenia stuttgartiensis]MCL4726056.1 hypothetical protein [Candidatus Kuenenia stuttgartiensis]MCZ7622354.1 hypothetical protein [Candidatus Kuenenia sp.]
MPVPRRSLWGEWFILAASVIPCDGFLKQAGVVELLDSGVKLYDKALHRAAVLLWENHVAIEQGLSKRAREIFFPQRDGDFI